MCAAYSLLSRRLMSKSNSPVPTKYQMLPAYYPKFHNYSTSNIQIFWNYHANTNIIKIRFHKILNTSCILLQFPQSFNYSRNMKYPVLRGCPHIMSICKLEYNLVKVRRCLAQSGNFISPRFNDLNSHGRFLIPLKIKIANYSPQEKRLRNI